MQFIGPSDWQLSGLPEILPAFTILPPFAGDPIEVGAAAAVLQPAKSSTAVHHLLLSAFKSEGGHAEPGAGVMGLIRLAAQVGVLSDT